MADAMMDGLYNDGGRFLCEYCECAAALSTAFRQARDGAAGTGTFFVAPYGLTPDPSGSGSAGT